MIILNPESATPDPVVPLNPPKSTKTRSGQPGFEVREPTAGLSRRLRQPGFLWRGEDLGLRVLYALI